MLTSQTSPPTAPAADLSGTPAQPSLAALTLLFVAASVACGAPAMVAFNVPPSATFLNQAAALVGWGGFLVVMLWWLRGSLAPARARVHTHTNLNAIHSPHTDAGLKALALSLGVVGSAPLAAMAFAGLPSSLALSGTGLVAAAAVTLFVAATLARNGAAQVAFQALCVGLVVAGVLSCAVAGVQVFAPEWADGDWIAASAIEGRATGNLRQPNHLSSLLLWSLVAALWLGESTRHGAGRSVLWRRRVSAALSLLFIAGLVLSASRTGALGVLMLAVWGALDKRLSRPTRALLLLAPVLYALFWLGLTTWAHQGSQAFAGEARFSTQGDISSSRFGIWANTLALIKQSPWLGVGFGEFNFAWSLAAFPNRPVAFFDHTHNLPLQLAVELGVPLALLVMVLLLFALWRAFAVGRARGTATHTSNSSHGVMLHSAFVMVLLVAVHSLLEYPLWYAYFLLPTAFMWGLCLGGGRRAGGERDEANSGIDQAGAANTPSSESTGLAPSKPALPALHSRPPLRTARPALTTLTLLSAAVALGGAASIYDYTKVVAIFAPSKGAPPLVQRIAEGQRSWFFAHHAHYAAATTTDQPATELPSFNVATHYLLDTRIMTAWAKALNDAGDVERARHLAQRLREFKNPDSAEFFAPCEAAPELGQALPFQCTPPTSVFDHRDFR